MLHWRHRYRDTLLCSCNGGGAQLVTVTEEEGTGEKVTVFVVVYWSHQLPAAGDQGRSFSSR